MMNMNCLKASACSLAITAYTLSMAIKEENSYEAKYWAFNKNEQKRFGRTYQIGDKYESEHR